MRFLRQLLQNTADRELRAVVDWIAARCQEVAVQIADEQTQGMGSAEAKGYVRARIRGLVIQTVEAAMREHQYVEPQRHGRVHQLALQSVVAQALNKRQQQPAPAALRRAA